MADADIRWLQRLENYERALATLERALTLAASRQYEDSRSGWEQIELEHSWKTGSEKTGVHVTDATAPSQTLRHGLTVNVKVDVGAYRLWQRIDDVSVDQFLRLQ